jgi:fibrillarin-like pre-rRNA processing protein
MASTVAPKRLGPNLLWDGRALLTLNLAPGMAVYGEERRSVGGREYRVWNPRRSKLAALLRKGFKALPLAEDSRVLYLGAATGTTVSHLSDIVVGGVIFAVEISPTAFRKLLELGRVRPNVIPILANAAHPEAYSSAVTPVDLLYQDVAQRDQAGILVANLPLLRPGGMALLMAKARSVDVAEEPRRVYRRLASELAAAGLEVIAAVDLEPYEADHACLVLRLPSGGVRPRTLGSPRTPGGRRPR